MENYRGFDLHITSTLVTVYVLDEGWAEFTDRNEALAAIDAHLESVGMDRI